MKKSDLKTGMLFQYREGEIGMVINNCLVSQGGYLELVSINEDLTHRHNDKSLDIVKLSKRMTCSGLMPKYWDIKKLNCNQIWERKPEKVIEFDGVEYSESTLRSIIKKATD